MGTFPYQKLMGKGQDLVSQRQAEDQASSGRNYLPPPKRPG